MGQKEKNFCCVTGQVLSGRKVFPLQIIAGASETRRRWMVAFPLLWAGTQTVAAQPTLPCPSAVWICVNYSASTLIRGATAPPPLRTFELWPQWYWGKPVCNTGDCETVTCFFSLCFLTLVEHSKLRRIKTAAYSCFLCECRNTNVHQRTRKRFRRGEEKQTRLVIQRAWQQNEKTNAATWNFNQ